MSSVYHEILPKKKEKKELLQINNEESNKEIIKSTLHRSKCYYYKGCLSLAKVKLSSIKALLHCNVNFHLYLISSVYSN